jgi:3-hydroxyacyl-CoA dehydrogenase
MEREGVHVDERVRHMLKGGHQRFYESNQGQRKYFDFQTHTPQRLLDDSRTLYLASLKTEAHVVRENTGASLLDLGDGILCVEFHTKMNSLDADIVDALNAATDLVDDGKYDGLVIANDGENFSVGANLMMVYMLAQNKDWEQLNRGVREFQNANRRLRYCRGPVVAAPFQMALGGGCEICLWAPSIRAHAELYMGLVEVGVGLIPGAGGTVEMALRAVQAAPDDPNFPMEALLRRALETVAMAKVSTSAEEAKALGYLRPADGITLNRDHLLHAAKQQTLGLARAGYRPPRPRYVRLPGPSAKATFSMALRSMRDGHMISDHDLLISEKVAHVMTGGDTSPRVFTHEERLLELEREAFLSLCGEQKTQDRIQYMLMNNKPLRN